MAKSLHLRYLSEPFQEPSQPEAGSPTSLGFKNTHLSRTTRGRARRSQKKESGEGGLKLEAEKDNGLDNCAPSVRYIVRRLIRDGCSRGTAMPKSYIVLLFAVQAPVDVVSWIKGRYGEWTTFLALLIRVFFYIPDINMEKVKEQILSFPKRSSSVMINWLQYSNILLNASLVTLALLH
ncbi:hypothetical protein JHK87_019307 [Glycine soja]|nr:hypothetical protein JHK87_019307 [Glycine soja]